MVKSGIFNRHLYIFVLVSGLLLLSIPLYSQVNQAEMENLGPVEFINYAGPHAVIETRAAIRNIGFTLGQDIARGNARSGGTNRYFVIHSVSGPDGNKLDADIFGLGADVGVDHIRNLRLIIQGYLEAAYDYSESDAALLAEYITVYNAVYRGDLDYFSSRYKNPVMEHLTREKAGLSIRFDEWPGQTLILIPLGSGTSGQLSAIDTSSLIEEPVTRQLREDPDMGVDQRMQMVDFLEREAEEAVTRAEEMLEAAAEEERQIASERREIAEEREQLAQEREEIAQEREQIAQEREQPGADQAALDRREEELTEREEAQHEAEEELEEREEALLEREAAVEEQRQEAEAQELFAEEKREEAQDQRRDIAGDQQAIIDDPGEEPVPVLAVAIFTPNSGLGGLLIMDAITGRELKRSPLSTVNTRTIRFFGDRIIAIAGENTGSGAIRLVEIDSTSLEMVKQGNEDIARESLLWVMDEDLYAIIVAEGSYFLARFDIDLALQARSPLPVHTFASLLFGEDYIATQRADGTAILLNPGDLFEKK